MSWVVAGIVWAGNRGTQSDSEGGTVPGQEQDRPQETELETGLGPEGSQHALLGTVCWALKVSTALSGFPQQTHCLCQAGSFLWYCTSGPLCHISG